MGRAARIGAGWALGACVWLGWCGAAAPVLAQPTGAEAAPVAQADVDRQLSALSDAARQREALAALVKLGPGAVQPLVASLADRRWSWDVRAGAAWVLGELGDPRAVEGLKASWEGASEAPGTYRIQVALALATFGEKEPLRSFLAADADPILKAKAAISLSNLGDVESIPTLKERLADPDFGVFFAIALGRLGEPSGHELLRTALRDPDMRDFAAVALGLSGDTTVVYQLRFALENPDAYVRRDAVVALGKVKDKEALPKLELLATSDPDPRVREAAGKVVRRLAGPRRGGGR